MTDAAIYTATSVPSGRWNLKDFGGSAVDGFINGYMFGGAAAGGKGIGNLVKDGRAYRFLADEMGSVGYKRGVRQRHYDEDFFVDSYGFYRLGEGFVNEYGKEILKEPKLLGMYSVATNIGIAGKIIQKLIISGII